MLENVRKRDLGRVCKELHARVCTRDPTREKIAKFIEHIQENASGVPCRDAVGVPESPNQFLVPDSTSGRAPRIPESILNSPNRRPRIAPNRFLVASRLSASAGQVISFSGALRYISPFRARTGLASLKKNRIRNPDSQMAIS